MSGMKWYARSLYSTGTPHAGIGSSIHYYGICVEELEENHKFDEIGSVL